MKRDIKAGAIDQTIDVFVQDSSSTVGAGLAGLVFNTSGLKAYYRKGATGSATQLTLATQTVGGAHSDGGFVEIDATNMKGVYRVDLSDTIVSAAGMVTMYLYGATNMAPVVLELQVVQYDPFDAVRLGLTALPNANAEAAGGLYTRGTGAGQINQDANGRIDANVAAISTDSTAADNLEAATDGGSYNVGGGGVVAASVTGNVGGNVTGSVGSVASGGIAAASFAAGAIDASAIATNAIGSDELAASAITEIQTGLSTLDAAGVRAAVGLASANLDTQLTGIRTRQSTTVTKTATVQADAGNSATQILTDLSETAVDHWRYALVKLTSGALAEQVRKVTGYDGAGTLTFTDGFTGTPANGVTIELVND